MNIVVLDGYTLNPGDLSWEELEAFGSLAVFKRSNPQEVLTRARDSDIVLTNKTPLPASVLRQLNKVQYIGVLATGYNVVDVQAAQDLGIVVTNIPTYGTDSVAQMVFAHLLEITQHVGGHNQAVKQGEWGRRKDFCFWDFPLVELANKTMGIIGFGRIGEAVAKIALAFGMKILAHDPMPRLNLQSQDLRFCHLDELLSNSDIISLNCPLTSENQGLINQDTLAQMKNGAILINTSRGQLIMEDDLLVALNNGQVFAAGLDVLQTEPPPDDHPLFTHPNCHITPHIAWAPTEARKRLMHFAIENLKAFINGKPIHVVNSKS